MGEQGVCGAALDDEVADLGEAVGIGDGVEDGGQPPDASSPNLRAAMRHRRRVLGAALLHALFRGPALSTVPSTRARFRPTSFAPPRVWGAATPPIPAAAAARSTRL